jgi:hypothetical protein
LTRCALCALRRMPIIYARRMPIIQYIRKKRITYITTTIYVDNVYYTLSTYNAYFRAYCVVSFAICVTYVFTTRYNVA